MTVEVADQRVCLQLEGEDEEGFFRRTWVRLRDLLRDHLADLYQSDEERIALELMGTGPTVWLQALRTADGVARTFRVVGAIDISPNPNTDERDRMDRAKVAFMWHVPRAGIHLRFPAGVRAGEGGDIEYEDFRRLVP